MKKNYIKPWWVLPKKNQQETKDWPSSSRSVLGKIYRIFFTSIRDAKRKKEFISFLNQAVFKLTEKQIKIKNLAKMASNFSPYSPDLSSNFYWLLIVPKALAAILKKVLPSLIADQQESYVQDRYIKKTGRMIVDISKITDTVKS